MADRVVLTFQPVGKQIKVPVGTTVLEAAEQLDYSLDSSCGGLGTCGKCRLRLIEGSVAFAEPEIEHLSREERYQGIRLACCLRAESPLTLELLTVYVVPAAKLQLLPRERAGAVESEIHRYVVSLSPPVLGNSHSLWMAVEQGLPAGCTLSPGILSSLSAELWFQSKVVTVTTYRHHVLDLEIGETAAHCYGVAVDVGTTTLAAYLLDLQSGRLLASAAKTNGQQRYGADVVSRIKFAVEGEKGRIRLQRRILADINHLIAALCQDAGISKSHIYRLMLVGNTAMFHFFLGLDPYSLGTAPYIPFWDGEATFRCKEMGIEVNQGALGTFLPPIAGFVGSDTLAMILAEGFDENIGTRLGIDVGTNGETVLTDGNRILCCSNAAGPAFEGAHIEAGMQGFPGAIERVTLTSNGIEVGVIGHVPPLGICGSGLIDAVAALLDAGIIDYTGRLCSPETAPSTLSAALLSRIGEDERGRFFVLVPAEETAQRKAICLTQKDIRELQLATAAIAAAIRILMAELHLYIEDLDEVILAGAFGNHLSLQSSIRIGLLPPVSLFKIRFVGNAAGAGARQALLSAQERNRIQTIKRRVEYIELAGRADFQEHFVSAMHFPCINPLEQTNEKGGKG